MCVRQYVAFVNDSTLDFVCLNALARKIRPLSLFTYLELARLSLLPLCLSPDTVECERGFSSITKNEFQCMALAFVNIIMNTFVLFPTHTYALVFVGYHIIKGL